MKQIQTIIVNQFPELKGCTCTFLGAGFDSEAYLVNDTYIFKFPKHQKASDGSIKEIKALKGIQGKLPIEVPVVEFQGGASEKVEFPCWGYRKLPGEPLTPELLFSLLPEQQDEIAKQLAEFLKALHAIEIEIDDLEIDERENYEQDKAAILELVPEREPIIKLYEDLFNDEDYFKAHKTLIHHDLSSDHILFDSHTNKIVGIIDFGDVAIGDRDSDFLYLFEDEEEYGKEFALKVLEHYQHPNIDLVIKKFEFKQKYWCIEQFLLGEEHGIEEWCQEALENMRKLK